MYATTFTSREFCHKAGSVKRAADFGPVLITDRGQEKYVLLGIDEYKKLSKTKVKFTDLIALDESFDQFDFAPRAAEYPVAADFS
jgi:prevent-host-death family protein